MNIRYVQIEVGKYDGEIKSLPADVKGPYAALLFHLLTHDGWIKDDMAYIAQICGTGELELASKWRHVGAFLNKIGGKYFHKTIRSDIGVAKKRLQDKRRAGLIGSDVKKHCLSTASAVLSVNENEIRKGKSSFSSSRVNAMPSLSFARELNEIIPAKSSSDWKSYENIGNIIAQRITAGKTDEKAYQTVREIALRARAGKKPIGLFYALLKRECNYIRPSRGGMGTLSEGITQTLKDIENIMEAKNAV
jgi:uncharacterized protein YdaU (DUF1376 family)